MKVALWSLWIQRIVKKEYTIAPLYNNFYFQRNYESLKSRRYQEFKTQTILKNNIILSKAAK